jgi:hypothetical protein
VIDHDQLVESLAIEFDDVLAQSLRDLEIAFFGGGVESWGQPIRN